MCTIVEKDCCNFIKPLVKSLLENLQIGLRQKGVNIKDLRSGQLVDTLTKDTVSSDRFKISFELAGDQISWEIVFDQEFPSAPPDFIFGDEDSLFCPDLETIECYKSWNSKSEMALSELISELIEQYLSFQRDTLLSLPKVKPHWEEVVMHAGFYAKNCEVHFKNNSPGVYNAVVSLMFNLPIDLSRIPAYLIKDNPGQDKVCLQVSFQPPDLTRVVTRVFLSPRVDRALGGKESLRIPVFGSHKLLGYILKLEEFLNSAVLDVCNSFEKRKELVATFLSKFSGSVIEYDSEGFYEIILLLQMNSVFFILYVMLGNRYPADPPGLVIQSITHATPQGPYRENRNDFKYSPRWESEKIVEKIRDYLVDVIPLFQQAAKRY